MSADATPAGPGNPGQSKPGPTAQGQDKPGKKGHLAVVAGGAKVRKPLPAEAPAPVPGDKAKPAKTRTSADHERAQKARKRKRNRSTLISFLVLVGIPALIASLYFGFIASDKYHSEARFAVRGTETANTDLLGMITGSPSGASNVGDSYILQQYILSREMVEAVSGTVNVEAVFNRPEADFWSRLGEDRPIEELVDYWAHMVSAEFDVYSGIISLEVKAFRPEDAQVLATAIVRESDALVNRLAAKARADAISFAQKEVEFAEWRLQDARRALTTFQSARSTFDPSANAAANQALVAELQGRLADAESELKGLLTMVGPQAPSARVLKTRIAALEAQIAAERGKISGAAEAGGDPGLSGDVADYQELKTAEEFAQQVYVSALKGLETARANAKRTHSYLATFVTPMLPQDAIYPKRITETLLVLVVAIGLWAVASLLWAAVRDHVS
jgi:capsular polysaccharide transport system permease protein